MAGGRVLVSVDALYEEIAETNSCLQKRIDGAQACITALQAYCDELNLKGAAYTNSQEFYSGTYIPLFNQVKYACNEIIALNETLITSFSRYVPDTRGFAADTDVMEEEIERLERENDVFSGKIESYASMMVPVPPFYYAPDNSGIIQWYQGRIWINEYIIGKLSEIVGGLRSFNSACAGVYDETNALLSKLSTAVTLLQSSSNWNSNANQYIVPNLLADTLAEIEYEKMIIHNSNGSISLNSEYVESVFQQEAIPGTPTEIVATYLALIKTFENISEAEDIEAFLNACYIKREIAEPISSDYTGNMNPNASYEYFNRQGLANNKVNYEYSLSPVFLEMVNYYNNHVIIDTLDELFIHDNLTDERGKELVNRLKCSGILNNIVLYGDQTYDWKVGQNQFHAISATKGGSGELKIHINSSGEAGMTSHDIVQYDFSKGTGVSDNGKGIAFDYILSTIKRESDDVTEALIDQIIGGLGLLCPAYTATIEGSAALIMLMGNMLETIDQNSAAQGTLEAMTITDAMGALGIEGQICMVDGTLKIQYANLDKDFFLKNYAAYKVYLKSEELYEPTIEEFCSSPDAIKGYITYYKKQVLNEYIEKTAVNEYHGSVEAMINDKVPPKEREILNETLNEYMLSLPEGETL